MMRRGILLVLALSLAFGLCACTAGSVNLAGGTWTEAADRSFSVDDYTAPGEIRSVPEDWTLPEDLAINRETRTEVCGSRLLYGPVAGSAVNGFTVADYAGEGSLSTVYEFSGGITVAWQHFFCEDGTRIAFPWKRAPEAEAWSLRVVDLDSGGAEDLDLPEGAEDKDLLLCTWEDGGLLVTAVDVDFDYGENPPRTWTYRFPD